MPNQFDSVYSRIMYHSGTIFNTKSGLPFVYQVTKGMLEVNRTGYKVHARSNIKKAIDLMPLSGPSGMNGKVRMPSYIWGILNDPRIKNGKDVPGKWYEVTMTNQSLLPDYNLGARFYARKVNGHVEIKSDVGLTHLSITKEVAKDNFAIVNVN